MNGYIEQIGLVLISITIGYLVNRLSLVERTIKKVEEKVVIIETRLEDIKNI